jgi:predicted HTH domain antitoxin
MQITFPLPEGQFVADSVEGVTEKVRLYAALGMYRAGELSIGAACELAGVDRYVFLDFCKREKVPLQTQTPEELQTEFERTNARE